MRAIYIKIMGSNKSCFNFLFCWNDIYNFSECLKILKCICWFSFLTECYEVCNILKILHLDISRETHFSRNHIIDKRAKLIEYFVLYEKRNGRPYNGWKSVTFIWKVHKRAPKHFSDSLFDSSETFWILHLVWKQNKPFIFYSQKSYQKIEK